MKISFVVCLLFVCVLQGIFSDAQYVLKQAVAMNDTSAVSRALSAGADINHVDNAGLTSLKSLYPEARRSTPSISTILPP